MPSPQRNPHAGRIPAHAAIVPRADDANLDLEHYALLTSDAPKATALFIREVPSRDPRNDDELAEPAHLM